LKTFENMMRSREPSESDDDHDDALPHSTNVVVVVDASGEIVECLDFASGSVLRHEFVVKHSVVHKQWLHSLGRRVKETAPDASLVPRVDALPSPGACLLFPLYDSPPPSGFPFGINAASYCEGFLMVEIQGVCGEVLDDTMLLKLRFEMETAFLGPGHVNAPGLITTQREKEDISNAVSPFHHAMDPILKPFREGWRDEWVPGLSSSHNHFVGVYKSDWTGVSPDVCVTRGHDVQVHYYLVVRGGLAETTAEQLVWLFKSAVQTRDETWENRAGSNTLAQATHMARWSRESLLARALDVCNVKAIGERVSTEWNVCRPALQHVGNRAYDGGGGCSGGGGVESKMAFYSLCANTSDCKNGILTTSSCTDPRDGIMWVHGVPSHNKIGGKQWSNTESANAFPVFRGNGFASELETLTRFGYERKWGCCFLKPLFIVQ
jgi:hypothetical protein